jgi:23S rRNA (cytidine1920-2'-O)/16S rRNA (cytidine1409-2'-O)-methyltransferase
VRARIDQLVVRAGLAPSREKAQALILAGQVLINNQKADKPGRLVAADAEVRLLGQPLPFVSRGGIKLAAALDHFALEVAGKVALDIGASTGGFTDCLLQRGARRVYAVDTGSGQLDWRLRTDPRVALREKLNARHLKLSDLGEPVDLATIDVSFISATLILPRIPAVLAPGALGVIVLVKPQFEAGPSHVGKGGIVRDPAVRTAAVEKVAAAALAAGFTDPRSLPSPITGAEGNQEFLLYARTESVVS